MRALTVCLLLFTLCCVLSGCGDGSSGVVSGTGTIQRFLVEGGGWKLTSDAGPVYVPDNLTADFQIENLRVSFAGHLTGAVTFQQVGMPIHLDEIHKLP